MPGSVRSAASLFAGNSPLPRPVLRGIVSGTISVAASDTVPSPAAVVHEPRTRAARDLARQRPLVSAPASWYIASPPAAPESGGFMRTGPGAAGVVGIGWGT